MKRTWLYCETGTTLCERAEKEGFLATLAPFGTPIKVNLPLKKALRTTTVEDLQLSVRSTNCLKRTGAKTVDDVCDVIMSEKGLASIRNLGRKSISEIKTTILVRAYDALSQCEKREFWDELCLHQRIIR